jgi:hypothetical protein
VRAPISSARAIISEDGDEEVEEVDAVDVDAVVGVSEGVANVVIVVEDVVRDGALLPCCCCCCCCRFRKDWIDRGVAGGANPSTPQRLSLVRLLQLAKAAAVRRVALPRVMVWSGLVWSVRGGILLPEEEHRVINIFCGHWTS